MEDELKIMREIAGRCPCGWHLPISVFSYPKDSNPGPQGEGYIAGAYVELVCPLCGRGHRFFTSREDMPGVGTTDA